MNADDLPVLLPPQVHHRLVNMEPFGAYGISYDIFTRATEDDLPAGWHAHRCKYYA